MRLGGKSGDSSCSRSQRSRNKYFLDSYLSTIAFDVYKHRSLCMEGHSNTEAFFVSVLEALEDCEDIYFGL